MSEFFSSPEFDHEQVDVDTDGIGWVALYAEKNLKKSTVCDECGVDYSVVEHGPECSWRLS